jgi:hypothetical protein
MAAGIYPKQLGPIGTQYGGVPFVMYQMTVAGTATYNIPDNHGLVGITPALVIGFGGVMTGVGGAGDTVQLQDQSGNAISEAIDVSALTTGDTFSCATLTVANAALNKDEGIRVVTASGATALCFIQLVRA